MRDLRLTLTAAAVVGLALSPDLARAQQKSEVTGAIGSPRMRLAETQPYEDLSPLRKAALVTVLLPGLSEPVTPFARQ